MNELTTLNNGKLTMSSREIAELTEKQHKEVLRDIRTMLDGLSTERNFALSEYTDSTGRKLPCYNLPKRETLILVSGYSIALRAKIIDRWQELENQLKKDALPDFTDPAEAARAWANEYEQRLLVEKQRDEAIKTKAWIGNRREATSMATASAAVRKANALQVQLDKSKEYSSIKRVEMMYPHMTYNWRELKAASNSLEKDIIKIPDQNYGEVNAYHKDVWCFVYGIDI